MREEASLAGLQRNVWIWLRERAAHPFAGKHLLGGHSKSLQSCRHRESFWLRGRLRASLLPWLIAATASSLVGCGGSGSSSTPPPPNPVPSIASLSPSSTSPGGGAFTLAVNGSNFTSASTVQWNGSARTTSYMSPSQLTASIPANDTATAGTANVTVFNPAPAGGTSQPVSFKISNLVPSVSNLSPASTPAGGGAFPLLVNGNNFLSTSTVQWNGSSRTTTYVSATELSASITAADIATAG